MYDIIIAGAGPAGMTAAIYARRASKKVLVLDGKSYGGQIINTLDIDLFNEQMAAIIAGEKVQMPKFDFTIAKRVPGDFIQVPKNSPIIIEGIHALNELMSESIPAHQKFKIFISPQMQVNIDDHSPLSTTDLRLIRRIVRDKQFRNASA